MRLTRLWRSVVFVVAFALSISVPYQNQLAQSQSEKTPSAELHQALLDLTNPWTVMCVAAHPDDEDGSTLTVLRRKYGVHTVSLFSTYGEGGQNAVGPELYEELGVIRARETIAASALQGSEPYFLGFKDFGFSKSAEETFRAWGEREALRRMVFHIRKLRPDVIITNHNTTSGHGHHQATGRLILQAFDAAADPQQFPEQLTQLKPWQVQRLFVRVGRSESPGGQVVTIDPNEMDPVRGMTYAQQALLGLQQHATQGPWPKSIPVTGGRISRYGLVKAAAGVAPLPADAKTPLEGLQLPEALKQKFRPPTIDEKPLQDFEGKPAEILIALVNARKKGAFTAAREVMAMDPQRFDLMSSRLDKALATATGVSMAIKAKEDVLVPDEKARFVVTLVNSGEMEVAIRRWTSSGLPVEKQLDPAEKLLPGTDTFQELTATVPKRTPVSVPASEHLYDGRLFGETLSATAELEIGGTSFFVSAEKQVDVARAVTIETNDPAPCVETPATVLRCDAGSFTLENHLHIPFHGALAMMGLGHHAPVGVTEMKLEADEKRRVLTPPIQSLPSRELVTQPRKNGTFTVSLTDWKSKEQITQKTIPFVYIRAVAPAGLRVGFIPSTDQTLEQSLKSLGVQAKELKVEDLNDDLSVLNSIIIDNRGYEIHPDLVSANDKLLKYVEDGGTLIVFYHKDNEWNPDERRKRPQLAPYPIIVNDDRVTEEDAPVRFLQPGHRLLNFPNRITQKDFAGWIQERGLYFPREWDSHYTAILSTNDKGERPLNGGLLVAKYGKGNYIYTSIVWYRQLRAGVPGGYRFFANLISYGKR